MMACDGKASVFGFEVGLDHLAGAQLSFVDHLDVVVMDLFPDACGGVGAGSLEVVDAPDLVLALRCQLMDSEPRGQRPGNSSQVV